MRLTLGLVALTLTLSACPGPVDSRLDTTARPDTSDPGDSGGDAA